MHLFLSGAVLQGVVAACRREEGRGQTGREVWEREAVWCCCTEVVSCCRPPAERIPAGGGCAPDPNLSNAFGAKNRQAVAWMGGRDWTGHDRREQHTAAATSPTHSTTSLATSTAPPMLPL